MHNQTVVARRALRAALQLRRSLSIGRESAVNVYDIASAVGIEVRFVDCPSLEGMFVRDPQPTILLPCLTHRPRGRIAFSCAHELGHYLLGHGTRVDDYLAGTERPSSKDPEERAADIFASYLLMPRQAVLSSFQRRGLDPSAASPFDILVIAAELGVGYHTLLFHMASALKLVPSSFYNSRRVVTPQKVRAEFFGERNATDLLVVDRTWSDVPVDLEVGGLVAVPKSSVATAGMLDSIRVVESWKLLQARRPGIGYLSMQGRTLPVRIARRGYVGPFKNRFLEDPDG